MTKLFGSSAYADFADRKQLAADKTHFCIESAKLVTQNDGKTRWYLTIWLSTGDGALEVRTLTFDRSASRDAGFQERNERGSYPIHSCWVEKREFKSKHSGMMQTFYELNFDDKATTCPCGDLGKKDAADGDPLSDLEEHPF